LKNSSTTRTVAPEAGSTSSRDSFATTKALAGVEFAGDAVVTGGAVGGGAVVGGVVGGGAVVAGGAVVTDACVVTGTVVGGSVATADVEVATDVGVADVGDDTWVSLPHAPSTSTVVIAAVPTTPCR
jgi:cytoskeletal protein CcmA (bactofilin family)